MVDEKNAFERQNEPDRIEIVFGDIIYTMK